MIRLLFFSIIIYFFISFNELKADESTDTSKSVVNKFLESIYKYPKIYHNRAVLGLSYGISLPSVSNQKFKESFSRAYLLNLMYGFQRVNPDGDYNGHPYLSSEFVYLENLSSNLKPKSWSKENISFDSWRFGTGFTNGYGYEIKNRALVFLYHSGILDWTRFEFEGPAKFSPDQSYLNLFDQDFRFGTSFETGIKVQSGKYIMANLSYVRSDVFSRTLFLQWSIGAVSELLMQRIIDYLGQNISDLSGDYFPVVNFIIKNAVTLGFYSLRKNNMFFPFSSNAPVTFDDIKIGINFII